jgi:hypothetical protein
MNFSFFGESEEFIYGESWRANPHFLVDARHGNRSFKLFECTVQYFRFGLGQARLSYSGTIPRIQNRQIAIGPGFGWMPM